MFVALNSARNYRHHAAEIDQGDEIRSPQLLEQAFADELHYEDISTAAGVQLVDFGAAVTTVPSEKFEDAMASLALNIASGENAVSPVAENEDDESGDCTATPELTAAIEKVEKFIREKERGQLACMLSTYDWSPRPNLYIHRQDHTSDGSSKCQDDPEKGSLTIRHDSFGMFSE